MGSGKEIYKGIDILYYEREGVIKWDFIVEPNKNINNILLNLNGANNIELDDNGDINVNIKERILKISKPEAYQNNNDEKTILPFLPFRSFDISCML